MAPVKIFVSSPFGIPAMVDFGVKNKKLNERRKSEKKYQFMITCHAVSNVLAPYLALFVFTLAFAGIFYQIEAQSHCSKTKDNGNRSMNSYLTYWKALQFVAVVDTTIGQ